MMKPRIAIPVPNSKRPLYVSIALPQYERAIRNAGGEPVVIPLNTTSTQIAQPEKYGATRHP